MGLSKLFNLSLSIREIPDKWKLANVIPIFKKWDLKYCNNYHPISLLCSISKVFEKIIFNHISNCHGLINEHQSGFTQGDTTIDQFIGMFNKLYNNIGCGNEILAVCWILQKHLIKFGTNNFFIKLKHVTLKEIYWNG